MATATPTTATTTTAVNGFAVRPDALYRAAGHFDTEAELLAHATATLRQQLGQLGPCWGSDAVGARFAEQYQPAADVVLTNLGALAAGLVRIGAALHAVGIEYERGEDELLTPLRRAAAEVTT